MRFFSFILIGFCFFNFRVSCIAQDLEIKHMEPAHWWLGMKNRNVQVMLHGPDISKSTITASKPGFVLKKVNKTANPNYVFLDFEVLPTALPGSYPISLSKGAAKKTIQFSLRAKSEMAAGAKGYGPEDVLYLIMPDRFANGNPANDYVEGYREKPNRKEPFGRHGGDLAGIENHLDYFENLGITTLWINPVLENNQPNSSYHGYSITDFYGIDARFGNLDDYKRLTQLCHKRKMKMVQDMVANHIGSGHWWMDDLPDTNWIHPKGDPFNRCNFRIEAVCDPNIAQYDKRKMLDGWFDNHMPDLNQRHPFLANYLIQNSIWWVAEVGIDGIRMDTYPYNDPDFMTRYCESIQQEFPGFSIVGEVWVETPAHAAYFCKGAKNQDGYKAGLPSVTDFPTFFGITKGLQEKGGWDTGLQKVYGALAQDFLYKDPSQHLIFLDNHDLTRFYTSQKEDFKKFKQGIGMLLTLRGVPQLYYGTEVLMAGDGGFHPDVRKNFPGGWPGDSLNFFEPQNLKGKVDSAFQFVRQMLQWRKTARAVTKGKFIQFIPEDNIYVYFRKWENEMVMVAVNGNSETKSLDLKRFSEMLKGKADARDVLSGKVVSFQSGMLSLEGNGISIFQW